MSSVFEQHTSAYVIPKVKELNTLNHVFFASNRLNSSTVYPKSVYKTQIYTPHLRGSE
jgi:hypothetical protein